MAGYMGYGLRCSAQDEGRELCLGLCLVGVVLVKCMDVRDVFGDVYR